MRTYGIVSLALVLLIGLMFAGCAGKQQETPPPPDELEIDTTDFGTLGDAEDDTLPSMEEQERIRLEEQRLAEQRAAEKERQARESLETVYFGFDQSALTEKARQKLSQNAEILRQYPNWQVIVEGHTDERGTTEYNLALGERRADAVKQYYVSFGIAADRIRLISYGEERPAVQGTGEAVWKQNRRAVTAVR